MRAAVSASCAASLRLMRGFGGGRPVPEVIQPDGVGQRHLGAFAIQFVMECHKLLKHTQPQPI